MCGLREELQTWEKGERRRRRSHLTALSKSLCTAEQLQISIIKTEIITKRKENRRNLFNDNQPDNHFRDVYTYTSSSTLKHVAGQAEKGDEIEAAAALAFRCMI